MSKTVIVVGLLVTLLLTGVVLAVLQRAVPEVPLTTSESAVIFVVILVIVFLAGSAIRWIISRARRG